MEKMKSTWQVLEAAKAASNNESLDRASDVIKAWNRSVLEWAGRVKGTPIFGCLPWELREQLAGDGFDLQPKVPYDTTLPRLEMFWQEAEGLSARQDAGECVVNFRGSHDRGGGQGDADAWVVQPEGSLRPADIEVRGRQGRRVVALVWRLVRQGELLLAWSGHTRCPGAGGFEVVFPKDTSTLTDAQREAVRQIEEGDLRVPRGSFGLETDISAEWARIAEVVTRVVQEYGPKLCDRFNPRGEIEYPLITGGSAFTIGHKNVWSGTELRTRVRGKDARHLRTVNIGADGRVQFLCLNYSYPDVVVRLVSPEEVVIERIEDLAREQVELEVSEEGVSGRIADIGYELDALNDLLL